MGARTATLKWDPVDCASSYDAYVREVGGDGESYKEVPEGDSQIVFDDLKPCTSYEVTVSAYLGDEVGDYLGTFATK